MCRYKTTHSLTLCLSVCVCISGVVATFSVPTVPTTHCRCHNSTSTSRSVSVSIATAKQPHPPILLPLQQPTYRTPLMAARRPPWALALRCETLPPHPSWTCRVPTFILQLYLMSSVCPVNHRKTSTFSDVACDGGRRQPEHIAVFSSPYWWRQATSVHRAFIRLSSITSAKTSELLWYIIYSRCVFV